MHISIFNGHSCSFKCIKQNLKTNKKKLKRTVMSVAIASSPTYDDAVEC